MSDRPDIVATWPKRRQLCDYLHELERAADLGQVINFRVPSLPTETPERCYMVYDGQVQGWCRVLACRVRGEGEVARVEMGRCLGYWPAGKYIVRDPAWHPIEPVPMRGFQGWRYYKAGF